MQIFDFATIQTNESQGGGLGWEEDGAFEEDDGDEGDDGGTGGEGTEPPKPGSAEWLKTLPEEQQALWRGAQGAASKAQKEAKALQARVAAFEAEQEAAKLKAAEEAGQFQELYGTTKAELEATKERVAAFEAKEAARTERLMERNAGRIDKLPENLKALLPDLTDPEAMAAWLDKASAQAGTTRPAGTLTKPRGATDEPIPQECIDEAKKYGKEPRYWFDVVWSQRKVKPS